MTEAVKREGGWNPLAAIASEELGIRSFVESGKVTTDVQLVRISSVERTLERAYDFGLLIGHTVSRAEHPNTKPSKLACRSEQDQIRAAAKEMIRLR
ncbi:hypothetical protein PQR02_28570 [Paraburkholderia sediminicola]|uniref:Uncharacterized protein n=1 Tax=Paraburkholderia rhynchosiae TaxID=487049 RepID=A0ACC7NHW7_9BURK